MQCMTSVSYKITYSGPTLHVSNYSTVVFDQQDCYKINDAERDLLAIAKFLDLNRKAYRRSCHIPVFNKKLSCRREAATAEPRLCLWKLW